MGTEWALQQARQRVVLVGGFHSPLEQSALRLVLEAGGSAVVVLARPVASASLHSAWRDALTAGKMAVVSASATTHRLTAQAACDRNELAARLADRIVMAYASPGGQLSRQAIEPLIGHIKADHGMQRCWLKGALGDALHALSCAAGFNIRWLMRAIAAQAAKDAKAFFFALFGLVLWGRIGTSSALHSVKRALSAPCFVWQRLISSEFNHPGSSGSTRVG